MIPLKECFLILMSSGLDSTAAFLKLINTNQNDKAIFFPIYIWWKTKSIDALTKEIENCEKIIKYITEKYLFTRGYFYLHCTTWGCRINIYQKTSNIDSHL